MAQSPILFDRDLLRVRRARAAALGPVAFLLDRVATELSERLSVVLRKFELAADLGTPGDAVRHVLENVACTAIAVDAQPELRGARAPFTVAADLEALPFRDGVFDLAVSALALQFVNDLPGTDRKSTRLNSSHRL